LNDNSKKKYGNKEIYELLAYTSCACQKMGYYKDGKFA
jgi:hypothetical protein